MTVISEPEVAIAVGRCLTARSLVEIGKPAMIGRHVRTCGWCDYPLEDLRRMLDGFNAWADYNARSNTFAHHDLRVWSELPRDEQERRIVEAQAYPPPAESMPAAPSAPAHDVDEEGPAWLR